MEREDFCGELGEGGGGGLVDSVHPRKSGIITLVKKALAPPNLVTSIKI